MINPTHSGVAAATLLALAERCEKATGPDRELDCDIARLTGWHSKPGDQYADHYWGGGPHDSSWTAQDNEHPPIYTASIDAALTLYDGIAEGVPEYVSRDPRRVCAAALRLRVATEELP